MGFIEDLRQEQEREEARRRDRKIEKQVQITYRQQEREKRQREQEEIRLAKGFLQQSEVLNLLDAAKTYLPRYYNCDWVINPKIIVRANVSESRTIHFKCFSTRLSASLEE